MHSFGYQLSRFWSLPPPLVVAEGFPSSLSPEMLKHKVCSLQTWSLSSSQAIENSASCNSFLNRGCPARKEALWLFLFSSLLLFLVSLLAVYSWIS